VDVWKIIFNAFCMMISGGRTEQLYIIAGFLPHHWLYEFHSCGIYSVLSQSHSIFVRIFVMVLRTVINIHNKDYFITS